MFSLSRKSYSSRLVDEFASPENNNAYVNIYMYFLKRTNKLTQVTVTCSA